MKAKHLVMAATALALGASFGTLAQESSTPVVRGETVIVQSPKFNGTYVTEKDGLLLNDAMARLDADRATRNALLSLVADNGELTVMGTTMDVAQSSRVEMKLRAVPGVRKVYAFLDVMTGDSQ